MSEHQQHTPVNVNFVHRAELAASTLNMRIAVALTKAVGTMECAYFFTLLALIGFPGWNATPTQYVQWTSQTLIQLVMLSVIMVGQSVISRKQELQADEQYETTKKLYADVEELKRDVKTILARQEVSA